MSKKSYKRNQNRLYREIKRRIIAEQARIMEDVLVVRCKNCKNGGVDSTSYPHYWCTRHNKYVREDYFCADGERKGARND